MLRLNEAARNKKRSVVSESDASDGILGLIKALKTVSRWASEIEPVSQPARFGNIAFRSWHSRLVEQAGNIMESIVKTGASSQYFTGNERTVGDVAEELSEYLKTSFGNETRIDYGSGHEAHFLVLLFCLMKAGVLTEEDDEDVVLLVFPAYLKVTRLLQKRYMLEPAGSHGVWGLDDYSFLPFLWGSSQLVSSQRINPSIINDEQALKEQRDEYLYVDAVAFIRDVKKGPFHEHSPMLFEISGVKGGWAKINQGMIKMYKGEVWNKRPVIQHFLFGSLFRFEGESESL